MREDNLRNQKEEIEKTETSKDNKEKIGETENENKIIIHDESTNEKNDKQDKDEKSTDKDKDTTAKDEIEESEEFEEGEEEEDDEADDEEMAQVDSIIDKLLSVKG